METSRLIPSGWKQATCTSFRDPRSSASPRLSDSPSSAHLKQRAHNHHNASLPAVFSRLLHLSLSFSPANPHPLPATLHFFPSDSPPYSPSPPAFLPPPPQPASFHRSIVPRFCVCGCRCSLFGGCPIFIVIHPLLIESTPPRYVGFSSLLLTSRQCCIHTVPVDVRSFTSIESLRCRSNSYPPRR